MSDEITVADDLRESELTVADAVLVDDAEFVSENVQESQDRMLTDPS